MCLEWTMQPANIAAMILVMVLGSTATNPNVVVTASAIDLTPEAIAANGLQAFTSSMLSKLESATALRATLTSQLQQLADTSNDALLLVARLTENPHDQALATQYQNDVAEMNSLRIQIEQIEQNLRDVTLQELAPAQRQSLAIWNESVDYVVPPEFRVRHREPSEWTAIEQAIIAERRAQRRGEPLQASQDQLLHSVRNEPEVVNAANNLAAYLPTVRSAFDQYMQ